MLVVSQQSLRPLISDFNLVALKMMVGDDVWETTPLYQNHHRVTFFRKTIKMLNAYGDAYGVKPAPPPRYASNEKQTERSLSSLPWRESVGVVLASLLSISVLFSVFCIFYYAQRDKAVYEELVDYLDKTIRPEELETLGEHRRYKALIWTFLFSDLGCYIFLTVSLFLYYSTDLSRPAFRILFWLFLILGAFYSLVEAGLFSALIFTYSAKLPNATEALLDHAVPHNPGGIMQMEHRLDCIFNQNLYNTFKRRQSPGNTCDPYILGSFISRFFLIFFVVCRVVTVLLFILLATFRNPIGDLVARLIIKSRPSTKYKNRYTKNPNYKNSNLKVDGQTPKSTTFGVKDNRSDQPPSTPPLGQLDHSISYNNAAFFAISGATAPGINSSRSSDISNNKCDVPDIIFNHLRGSTHTTNSLVSEV
uniref:Gustatory receptor n=1 Tax=Ditylenchus dipsaci TaxID=166011 RepID=A0A915CLU5_9BILA